MSELKAMKFFEAVPTSKEGFYQPGAFVDGYLKSEADKVIAKLKNEIEVQKRLRDMVLASVPNILKVMKIIQYHKYKRCLAMAKLCGKTVDHLNSEGYIYEKENHTKELTDCIRGTEFYDKWYHRWLALAEEPTWAKFLQLIHKETK